MNHKLANIIIASAIIILLGAIGVERMEKVLYSNNIEAHRVVIQLPDKNEKLENENKNEKININTATKEELIQLKGVGDKTAESIIEYRTNKKFETVEELTNVDGIGDKKMSEILPYIEVDNEVY